MSNTNFSAPVGCFDYPALGETIHPCAECLPWHVDITRDPETSEVIAREWHAVNCPVFIAAISGGDE